MTTEGVDQPRRRSKLRIAGHVRHRRCRHASYVLPQPADGVPVGGHTVIVGVAVSNPHGPGNYPLDTNNSGDLIIDAEAGAGYNDFGLGDGGAGEITLGADGSGSLVFTNWADMGGSGEQISGRLEWTCTPA